MIAYVREGLGAGAPAVGPTKCKQPHPYAGAGTRDGHGKADLPPSFHSLVAVVLGAGVVLGQGAVVVGVLHGGQAGAGGRGRGNGLRARAARGLLASLLPPSAVSVVQPSLSACCSRSRYGKQFTRPCQSAHQSSSRLPTSRAQATLRPWVPGRSSLATTKPCQDYCPIPSIPRPPTRPSSMQAYTTESLSTPAPRVLTHQATPNPLPTHQAQRRAVQRLVGQSAAAHASQRQHRGRKVHVQAGLWGR